MTPCEKLGYKVGQRFIAKGAPQFADGSIVELYRDDGTDLPCWKLIEGKCSFLNAGGYAGAYDFIGCFEPLDATMTIITRTNGQPYATEASARQQLTAKGLQDTHEVAPHEGGYALAPIQRVGDPITLQPGDHVSTDGMTEEQYHAVARAFENAGCPRFDRQKGRGIGSYLEWWNGVLDSTIIPENGGRHLTIDQVLGATNAGTTTPQPEEATMTTDPITTLKQARQARDEAEKAYQEALEEAREYLGEGFGLLERATADEAGEDMSDPANWRDGDVLTCIDDGGHGWYTEGKQYAIVRIDVDGWPVMRDDDGDQSALAPSRMKFHHRPT